MADLREMLTPPATCQAFGMPKVDRRRKALWHCPHARKNFAVSKKKPPCMCRDALAIASAILTPEPAHE
jgi:ribosomal protein L37AE/L43A